MECPICKTNDGCLITLPCHATHQFHRECILNWATNNASCPICRAAISVADLEITISPSAKRYCRIKVWLEPLRYGFYSGLLYYPLILQFKRLGFLFITTEMCFSLLFSVAKLPFQLSRTLSKSLTFSILYQLDWVQLSELYIIGYSVALPLMADQVLKGLNLTDDEKRYYDRLNKPSYHIRASLGFMAFVLGSIAADKLLVAFFTRV